MTKHHPHPTHRPDSSHRGDKPNEADPATARNLLNDAQGRWFTGAQPDALNKLVQDGVLPPGSRVIDFGSVSKHLDQDRKDLDTLNGTKPLDAAAAQKALDEAKGKLPGAQTALDAAQKSVDEVQKKIDDRTKKDQQIQKDFDTISKETKSTYFYESNLKSLSEDSSKSQEVRDAAKRLLDTFHKQGRGMSNSEYARTGMTSPFIDQQSITQKTQKDDQLNKADAYDLKTRTAERDKAKSVVDGVTREIGDRGDQLDQVNARNKETQDKKAETAARIKREEDALKPAEKMAELGKVTRGGGYYQVAERLLGLDHTRRNRQQENEVRMLTRMLQDEERKLHGGQLPTVLKQNDALLRPENMADMLERIRKIANPDKPA